MLRAVVAVLSLCALALAQFFPAYPMTAPVWTPCDVFTPGQVFPFGMPVVSEAEAHCAIIKLPYRYDNVSLGVLDYFVKRIRRAGTTVLRSTQIWFLQGGPGDTGVTLEEPALAVALSDPQLESYVPDHRGTGRSSLLTCAVEACSPSIASATCNNTYWISVCVPYFEGLLGRDRLRGFGTTFAANDVVTVARFLQANGGPATVKTYGVSYGTFLTNRVLTLDPNLSSGSVLDGVVCPGTSYLNYQAANFDAAARHLLDICTSTPSCGSRFGGRDVQSVAQQTMDDIKAGAVCPPLQALALAGELQSVLSQFLPNSFTRDALPAMFYRLGRCSADDVAFLTAVIGGVAGTGRRKRQTPSTGEDAALPQSSSIVQLIIGSSELFDMSYGLADIVADAAAAIVFPLASADLVDLWLRWPYRYVDPLAAQMAPPPTQPGAKLILLSGDLDAQTPLAWAQAYAAQTPISRGSSDLLIVPHAGHGTVSLLRNSMAPGNNISCGLQLVIDFVAGASFRALSNNTCFAGIAPIDFNATIAAALYAQSGDVWDGVVGDLPMPSGGCKLGAAISLMVCLLCVL